MEQIINESVPGTFELLSTFVLICDMIGIFTTAIVQLKKWNNDYPGKCLIYLLSFYLDI